jgi:acyl-coenzyme A thioesterase PaaI-like protein
MPNAEEGYVVNHHATERPEGAIAPQSVHPHCVVCGPGNSCGLGLRFLPSPGGRGVRAAFDCSSQFEGYTGLLHGGIVSAILDGAMAHCLFRLGRIGHTGSLTVRFRHPVLVDKDATVEAWLEESRGRLHVLSARLEQGGQVKVEASARFMEAERPDVHCD